LADATRRCKAGIAGRPIRPSGWRRLRSRRRAHQRKRSDRAAAQSLRQRRVRS
jgi:hypothetical protein